MVKKINGWVCDICLKFFTHEPITTQGTKRLLHFCTLRCKAKYLKWKKNIKNS